MHAEQLTAAIAEHAEGPVWHDVDGALRWVDMLAGDILGLPPNRATVSRHHVGDGAAGLRPRSRGGPAVAVGA